MAFVKVKLDELDIDVENLKKRIDHKIQNSSPKQTLLSEARMHDGGTCAFDENSNTLFFSITPMSLLYRDGYDCCVQLPITNYGSGVEFPLFL